MTRPGMVCTCYRMRRDHTHPHEAGCAFVRPPLMGPYRDGGRARETRRRASAERIARAVLALNLASPEDAHASDEALFGVEYTGTRVREMLTAAALQALTETENAR